MAKREHFVDCYVPGSYTMPDTQWVLNKYLLNECRDGNLGKLFYDSCCVLF